MRLLLAGDTHGQFDHVQYLIEQAKRHGCSRIVQVGDFGYWPHMAPFHRRVDQLAAQAGLNFWWLDGNHENFDALERAVDFDAAEPQPMGECLTYLPRGCTWRWDGVRFMAFGGAYSIDKAARIPGLSWWEQELPTYQQVDRALGRGPVDVLLTHDAPDGVCPIISRSFTGDEISAGNRRAISALVEAVAPRLVVHGHYHHRYTHCGRPRVEGLGCHGMGEASWLILDTADLPARGEADVARDVAERATR